METSCDLIIIGGGQAGIPLAQDLAAMGKQIVLAERKYLGGSCVNFGCTPTKGRHRFRPSRAYVASRR
jgi:pyruvate/2-oxoglutarate dehydrogenase complex dihydrolipoamide dehydrogenase (E3) component